MSRARWDWNHKYCLGSIISNRHFPRLNPSIFTALWQPRIVQQLMTQHQAPITGKWRQAQAVLSWENSYDRLPDIRVPTLVIGGKNHVLFPPENSRILAERISGSIDNHDRLRSLSPFIIFCCNGPPAIVTDWKPSALVDDVDCCVLASASAIPGIRAYFLTEALLRLTW